MTRVQLTLPYPPTSNTLYPSSGNRRVLSTEGKRYKRAVAALANYAGAVLLQGDVAVSIDVYRPGGRGDLDGFAKIILDALTGVCYEDDGQVTELNMRRFDDPRNPRAEVTVCEVEKGESSGDSTD